MKVNIGCGNQKLPDYINIDLDPLVEPDVVDDAVNYLKDKRGLVDKVVLFHTLEHIAKMDWPGLFAAVSGALKIGGEFLLSFPEFPICAKNYIENKQGKQEFWEATIFGRRISPSDAHVCACERAKIAEILVGFGFQIHYCGVEIEPHNSLIRASKVREIVLYEEEVRKLIWSQ